MVSKETQENKKQLKDSPKEIFEDSAPCSISKLEDS